VPWYMDCTGLYYNKERLEELGIALVNIFWTQNYKNYSVTA